MCNRKLHNDTGIPFLGILIKDQFKQYLTQDSTKLNELSNINLGIKQ